MQLGNCASSEAISACRTIHATCDAVSESQCVRDLSPLGADQVLTVADCVQSSDSTQCAYTYRECRGLPSEAIDVVSGCDEIIAGCSTLDRTLCESRLDVYGTGKLLDVTFYYYKDCIAKSAASCASAFDTCTQ